MNDLFQSVLSAIGIMFIVFIIFMFGYGVGIDHNRKQKDKIVLEEIHQRLCDVETKINT